MEKGRIEFDDPTFRPMPKATPRSSLADLKAPVDAWAPQAIRDAAYERAAKEVERLAEEFCTKHGVTKAVVAMRVDAMAAAIRALKGPR